MDTAYPLCSWGCGVAIPRKAAEPGVVQKIASFLGDNGYMRAWDGAARAGLRPLDRLIASDQDRVRALAPVFGRAAAADGGVGPVLREHMAMLDPTGAMEKDVLEKLPGFVDAKMQQTGRSAGDIVTQVAFNRVLPEFATPETLRRYDEAHGPSMPISEAGLVAHAALSNPLAAYGLPAAGVGLAAWGVHDLLMAQQQAEKDKQLPLQGGVN
jgi:hypothetical protein